LKKLKLKSNKDSDLNQSQRQNKNLRKCWTKKQKNSRNQKSVMKISSKTFSWSSLNTNIFSKQNELTSFSETKSSTSLMHFKLSNETKTDKCLLKVLWNLFKHWVSTCLHFYSSICLLDLILRKQEWLSTLIFVKN